MSITYTPEYFKNIKSINLADTNEVGLTPLMYLLSNKIELLGINISPQDFDYILKNSDLNTKDIAGYNALMHAINRASEVATNIRFAADDSYGPINPETVGYLIHNSRLTDTNSVGYAPLNYIMGFLKGVDLENIVHDKDLSYLVNNSDLNSTSIKNVGTSTNKFNFLMDFFHGISPHTKNIGIVPKLLEPELFKAILEKTDLNYAAPNGHTAVSKFIDAINSLSGSVDATQQYTSLIQYKKYFLTPEKITSFTHTELEALLDCLARYDEILSHPRANAALLSREKVVNEEEIKLIFSSFFEKNTITIDKAMQLLNINILAKEKYVPPELMEKIWENASYIKESHTTLVSLDLTGLPCGASAFLDNTSIIKSRSISLKKEPDLKKRHTNALTYYVSHNIMNLSPEAVDYMINHMDKKKFEQIFNNVLPNDDPGVTMGEYLQCVFLLNLDFNLDIALKLKHHPKYTEKWIENNNNVMILPKAIESYNKAQAMYERLPALEEKKFLEELLQSSNKIAKKMKI